MYDPKTSTIVNIKHEKCFEISASNDNFVNKTGLISGKL